MYVKYAGYKSVERLIHNLVDRVSKNGHLLLNVGPRPDGTIPEQNGRTVSWVIEGEQGETMRIEYDGIVPDLFTPRAFVVVEGVAAGEGLLQATSVIIRHEPEFVTDAEDASIAAP